MCEPMTIEMTGTAERIGQVPAQLSLLGQRLDRLMEVADDLEDELQPVLRACEETQGEKEDTVRMVPLADSIHELRLRLDCAIARFGSIVARVEL